MNVLEYIKNKGSDQQKKELEQLESNFNCPVLIGVSGTIAKTTVTELIGQYLTFIKKKVMVTGTSGIKINGNILTLSYPCTSAPTKQQLCEFFLVGIQNNVDYIIIETTAESTFVGVYEDLDFNYLTVTNIIKEIVRSFSSQQEYIDQKTKLYTNSKIDHLIYNQQCEKYLFNIIKTNKKIGSVSKFNKHDINYNIDRQGKLTLQCFGSVFVTNLLSSINLDNVLNFLVLINEMGLYNEFLLKNFLLNINIPGRLEHYNILGREVIIDSGYGGVGSVIPYFLESDYYNDTYIVLSTYCFDNDTDNKSIIKSFRQNKASTFGQYGNVILTTGTAYNIPETNSIALNQMQESLEVYAIEPIRTKAIELAFQKSQPGDRIFITGKGSENYNINETEFTNDMMVVHSIISNEK